jgi:carbohydrate-selective porin OprB
VFFGAGLAYTGLIPTRDEDNSAIGFYYGNFSDRIDGVSSEKVLEVNYTVQIVKWFYVRPDLQFIFDPSDGSHIPTPSSPAAKSGSRSAPRDRFRWPPEDL